MVDQERYLREEFQESDYEALKRLKKDLKSAASLLGRREVISLVNLYYQTQHYRISTAGQKRSASREEPQEILTWLFSQSHVLEKNLQASLGAFASTYKVGLWMQSICGIGPVISAGLLAHLDVRGVPTPCNFWSFAGLNPERKWIGRKDSLAWVSKYSGAYPVYEEVVDICKETGCSPEKIWKWATIDKDGKDRKATKANVASGISRRPWNLELKTLTAFKLGECFVKVQGNKNDFYGKLFRERRDLEEERNEALGFKEQAAKALSDKNYSKTTDAYKAYTKGKLPPAHLHARARRYCVKIFLSHLHYVMHWNLNGVAPAKPPIFSNPSLNEGGKHTHFIEPPNWPFPSDGKSLDDLYGLE